MVDCTWYRSERNYDGITKMTRYKTFTTACVIAVIAAFLLFYHKSGNAVFPTLSATPRDSLKYHTGDIEKELGIKETNHQRGSNANTRRDANVSRHEVATNDVTETRHIAFLKVHKAGSSTIQNILYRFGVSRNLTFVLSKTSHYLSKSKYSYNPIMPSPDYGDSQSKYDIICNHAVFNAGVYKQLMYADAEYFAIVRDPVDLLISAAYYYRDVWPAEYITNLNPNTFIQDLIHNPEKYEPRNLTESRTFNYMSRDFGLVIEHPSDVSNMTEARLERFIQHISDTFKLVLIMEKFDESLVLLRRHFRWTIKDILYVKNNVHQDGAPRISKRKLSPYDMWAFNRNFRADIRIYNHFLSRFENQTKFEEGFSDDVKCFQTYLGDVQRFCSKTADSNLVRHITLQKSTCSESFSVSSQDCSLMHMSELKFYRKLVHRHEQMYDFHKRKASSKRLNSKRN